MFILTVKEFFSNIKINIESSYPFIMIKGIVTDTKFDTKKNLYFTLSDNMENKCTISCVCWQTKLNKLSIDITKQDICKQEIIIKGYIQVYQTSTKISLIVIDILNVATSKSQLLQKKREDKLREQGYFDEKNKKPIPEWCNIVGIITSKESAAKQDIINRIQKRFPAKVLLYNTYTQGVYAVKSIIEAIEYFNSLTINKRPKVILITRGGGSSEDLDIFNEEELVIAIFKSKIPIITAIGHSKDISLSDYAADSYAITPTAASELLFIISFHKYRKYISQFLHKLNKSLLDKIHLLTIKKQIIESKTLDPQWILSTKKYQIKELQKNNKHIIQEKYKLYSFKLKEYQIILKNSVINEIAKYKNYLLQINKGFFTLTSPTINLTYKLLFIKDHLIQAILTKSNNKINDYKQIYTNFISLKPNNISQITQLKYLNNIVSIQTSLYIKHMYTNIHYLNNILESNSYHNILKRGFTIIKDPYTNTIIQNSTQLVNIETFEIVFYDKSIKINKK